MPRIGETFSRCLRALGVPRLSLRQIRISTGLVLFTYVTTHFLNHALANISVAAAESDCSQR
jgi:adenylate cyclase